MDLTKVVPLVLLLVVLLAPMVWALIRRTKMSPEDRKAEDDLIASRRASFSNPVDEQGNVKCPYCGSLQIQMVPRKWSPATGFFTNKADRVCMRCKKKF